MEQRRTGARRGRGAIAGLLALTLAFAAAVGAGTAAVAEILQATLSIEKTGPSGDDLPLVPGEPFNYVVTVQCSYSIPNSGCYNASMTDTIPAPLELAGTPTVVSDGNVADVSVSGNDVTVDFTTVFLNTTDPGVGMLGGTTATITIPVVVPADVDYDYSGEDIVNEAQFAADNPDTPTVDDDHVIDIAVPLNPATMIEKSFDPAEATASDGEPTTISLEASNDSGTGVDSFVITDPEPGSGSTTFDYLALDSITVNSVPAGADEMVVYVDTGSGLAPVGAPVDVNPDPSPIVVDLTSVDLDAVVGIQIEFTDTEDPLIANGATTDIDVGMVQRDPGELTDDVTVENTAGSEVSRDGVPGDDTADADYSITTNIPTVDASKEFVPDTVLHGGESTATISAGVTGQLDVDSLTVTEPSNREFDDAMSFVGFAGPVDYPAGADSATITYTTDTGTVGPIAFDDGTEPDVPVDPATIVSFTITFQDDDDSGIEASGDPADIPITVVTDPTDPDPVTDLVNEVEVTGTTADGVNGTDTAQDVLHAFDEHIDSTTTKSITPSTIVGYPGEWVVMQLSGGTAGSPQDGSTDDPYSSIPSQQIVVQDPVDPSAADPFWDAFDPTQIVDVNVPPDASLTVNYWDGSDWVVLAGPVAGPATFNYDIAANSPPGPAPSVIGGLQFQYDYTGTGDGFPPGTTEQPNVVMEFDPDNADTSAWLDDDPAVFTNCVTASAANGPVESGNATPACDDVTVLEPDPAPGPSMDKTFVDGSGNPDPSIPARSHRVTHAQLHWSTGGMANVDSLTLTDEATAPPGDMTASVYDTFDATIIGPIDASDDPLLQYDAIDIVQIHDGNGWVVPDNSPCGDLLDGLFEPECAGALPEIILTGGERESTVGVRIVYVANDAARGGVDGPPVGSGVARSTAADGRTAEITYRVRDWRRSELPALVAVDGLEDYNVGGQPGLVRNTASAVSVIDSVPSTVSDFTDIVITSVDLDVATTKTWDGSPVGIPPAGTAIANYPHTGMDLTVTNNSTIVYVDRLSIVDNPAADRVDPDEIVMSDVFDITSFDTITMPAGADSVTITVFNDAAPDLVTTDIGVATAWDEGDLANAVGFEIVFEGRTGTSLGGPGNPTSGGIAPEAEGAVDLTLRLRQTDRFRGVPIDEANYADETVNNRAVGEVEDAGRDEVIDPDPPTDEADASVVLEGFTIGVAVDKQFGPADGSSFSDEYTEIEPSREQFLLMLTAQPTDGARPLTMDVSDLDPSFWNAFEFVGVHPDFTLTEPIETVDMQWCTAPLDGALDGPITGGCERTVDGVDSSVTYAPLADIDSTGAVTGVPVLPGGVDPATVTGLIFTFASGEAWDDPWNPVQEIPIIVQRRETMLAPAGDDVPPPTDLDGNSAAPGETEAGRWTNTAQAAITAYLGEDGTSGTGINAVATDDSADVVYAHSITAATAAKEPDGIGPLSLAGPTEFTMTFENTGDTPIFNPVFTDVLPTDADGPILFVDPSPWATGDSPYTFELETSGGSLPAGWLPLPVDEADIVITPDPAPATATSVSFSFPDGYALGVGETYTISLQMLVRAGVSPDDGFFDNTAVVEGDRPFDYCTVGPFDPAAAEVLGSCEDTASNTVAAGGAIRSGKFVRAGTSLDPEYTFGALNVVDPAATCVTNVGGAAAGFYTTPCVPRTAPGDTETWRLVLRNTGNVDLSQIIAVDRMPAVGDGTALNPDSPRGSAWAPVLSAPVSSSQDYPGATLTVYVTEDEEPCTEIIQHSGDCSGAPWTLLDDYAGDLADLNGVMYIVDFADGAEIEPTEVVYIEAESTTPATAPSLTDPATAEPDPIAWNTVATSATTAGGVDLLATEGNAAGVALVTGSVEFTKAVTGDGAPDYAPDTFDVTVVCTSLGEEVYRQTFTVPADDSLLVENLPYGAECVLEESDQGQWTAVPSPDSVTVPDGSIAPATITLTNDYPLASLRITKEVLGDGSGGSANPEDAGPFMVGALCRYLGEVVFPTGGDPYTEFMSVAFQAEVIHGDTVTFTGLPAGAECIAGEIDPADADTVGVAWQTAAESGALTGDPDVAMVISDPFVLTPDDDGAPNGPTTNDVLVANQYAVGALEITKVVDEAPPGVHGSDTFTFDVYCVYERDPEDDVVTFDGPVEVIAGTTTTVDGIISGSVCTIEEPEDGRGGADQWVFDPPATPDDTSYAVVTIDEDTDLAQVTVTNVFEELTNLDVTKLVDDDPLNDGQGGVPQVGPFAVAVECVYEEGTPYERVVYATGYDATTPMENELNDGDVWLLEDLPTGTVCTVTETDAAGAAGTTVEAQNAGTTVGPLAGTSTDIALTPPGLLGLTTNHVTFVNEFAVGELQLAKVVDGDGAAERGEGPFTLHVECTAPTFGVASWSGDVVLGGDQPWTATIEGILAPSLCTVTETDNGGADAVLFDPGAPGDESTTVLVTAGGGQGDPALVTVTNHFEAYASLAVTKSVDDSVQDASGEVPDLGPYVISVECVYDPGDPDEHEVYAAGHGPLRPMIYSVDQDETVVLEDIPATSVCTVTELSTGGAASTTMTVTTADAEPVTIDGTSADATLVPGDDNAVDILNVYAVGGLVIEKTVSGPDVDQIEAAAGPFTFHIECTLERPMREPVSTYSGDVVIGGDQPLTVMVDGIAAGSVCLVTETDGGGADGLVLSPVDGDPSVAVVTIEADGWVVVTAENLFDAVLPLTGFDSWWLAVVAALLLGGGAVLVVVRTRVRED